MRRKAQGKVRPKELKRLYKRLLTTSVESRIATLATVLQWYDEAIEYLHSRPSWRATTERLSTEASLYALRSRAISLLDLDEKENHLRAAILEAEILCKNLHPLSVKKAYTELDRYREELQAKQKKAEEKYSKILGLLQQSIGPTIHLSVGNGRVRSVSVPAQRVVFSKGELREYRSWLRKEGLLPLVCKEIMLLSRIGAMEENGEGHFNINYKKQTKIIFEMLAHFLTFAKSAEAPRHLIRKRA